MSVDYADYQTPAAHATAIYTQRVPLARGVSTLGTAQNQALAGGASVSLTNTAALDQPSWECMLQLNLPAGAGTVPFAQLNCDWFMGGTAQLAWRDEGIGVAGSGAVSAITVGGMGPARGDNLTFSLTNLDPAQTLTYSYLIAAVSHVYDRFRWRQSIIPAGNPTGFSFPFGEPASGVLCSTNPTIAASTSQSRLLPPYLGRARMTIDNSGGANAITVTMTDPAGTILGSVQYYSITIAAAGAVVREEIWLPARPVLLVMHNNGGAGSISPQITIVTSEY